MDKLNKTLVDNWVESGKSGGGEKRERGGGCIFGIPADQLYHFVITQKICEENPNHPTSSGIPFRRTRTLCIALRRLVRTIAYPQAIEAPVRSKTLKP